MIRFLLLIWVRTDVEIDNVELVHIIGQIITLKILQKHKHGSEVHFKNSAEVKPSKQLLATADCVTILLSVKEATSVIIQNLI